MKPFFILLLYRAILPILFIIAFPGWVIKMLRRGGFGTGLTERIGIYTSAPEFEPCGAIHFHSISVGETMIALKLLREWRKQFPETRFVIATGTSTGHDVATRAELKNVRVTYSPLDFPWMIRRYLKRFEPAQIILIEGEIWPNFLRLTKASQIPVSLANTRVSPRSARRFKKFAKILRPFFSKLSSVCIQEEENRSLWKDLGIKSEKIHLTGSIKFDPQSTSAPSLRKDFAMMLDSFGQNRTVVLAASTFPGEETFLADAIHSADSDLLPVIVPRHAERRKEVKHALEQRDFEVILRSEFKQPSKHPQVFVIDSTGELATWTSHADIVLIGKSFLSTGGQNPAEAILAEKPLILGPYMENFQALVSQLYAANGAIRAETKEEVSQAIIKAMQSSNRRELTENASRILAKHEGATRRHLQALRIHSKPA
ncbi:MAG: 3-deoxy-D-manno-octulosonic acid transferase [Akkermansiaceae bacterium]